MRSLSKNRLIWNKNFRVINLMRTTLLDHSMLKLSIFTCISIIMKKTTF